MGERDSEGAGHSEWMDPVPTTQAGEAFLRLRKIEIPGVTFSEVLPSGANGAVFRGKDLIGRDVVVKVWIRRKEWDQRDKKQQGLEEARKLGRLSHPNVVKIHSADYLRSGEFFVLMDYVPGITLKTWLEDTQPSFRQRLRVWNDISTAISHAHGLEILHGDLHDRNVLVTADERARVIDFGTSALLGNPNSMAQKESKLLVRLAQQLFPETRMGDMMAVPLRDLHPFLTLGALAAWIDLLVMDDDYRERREWLDDMDIRSGAARLSILVGEYPFFSLDSVVAWWQSRHPNEWASWYFLDSLLIHLQEDDRGNPRPRSDDFRFEVARTSRLLAARREELMADRRKPSRFLTQWPTW